MAAAAKRATKERLRNVPFMLTADMFIKLLADTDVDLGVFFTNHIAANMHRYWYASFPEEFSDQVYSEEWVERYCGEIPFALGLFDSFVGRTMDYCRATNRVLIVAGSMGQSANPGLETHQDSQYVLDDMNRFLSALGAPARAWKMRSAIVPQYTLAFETAREAERVFRTLDALPVRASRSWLDLNEQVLTVSVRQDLVENLLKSLGKSKTPADFGLKSVNIDDHKSGQHHPYGTLIVYNGNRPAPMAANHACPAATISKSLRPSLNSSARPGRSTCWNPASGLHDDKHERLSNELKTLWQRGE